MIESAIVHKCAIARVHMKVVSVAMQKGGVGKSTLTRSLAVAAADAGLNVLVLDMDAQQSTRQWRDRRQAPLPVVSFVTEIDLARELDRARGAGCELVLIDTPPARSTEAPAAVEYSDYVIVPCTPDIESYEQLPRTLRLARTIGKPAAVVLTMATPNSRSEQDAAREVIQAIGGVEMVAVIHRLKVHRDASREGLAAGELEPEGKAAQEVAGLWNWLRAELQMCTSAEVRKRTRASKRVS
jgi:chromosome partitioning protein